MQNCSEAESGRDVRQIALQLHELCESRVRRQGANRVKAREQTRSVEVSLLLAKFKRRVLTAGAVSEDCDKEFKSVAGRVRPENLLPPFQWDFGDRANPVDLEPMANRLPFNLIANALAAHCGQELGREERDELVFRVLRSMEQEAVTDVGRIHRRIERA
jgi:hypothetical protein